MEVCYSGLKLYTFLKLLFITLQRSACDRVWLWLGEEGGGGLNEV